MYQICKLFASNHSKNFFGRYIYVFLQIILIDDDIANVFCVYYYTTVVKNMPG